MPEPKYNYLISTQEGQTFSIPEEEYERNKEKIFAKNPAGVWREQAWDANQQTNEWDNYAVTTSDGHQFAIDAAKFGSTRDKLFEKDPNAKVTRYSPIKWVDGKEYDAQSAADATARMQAFFQSNGGKMREYETQKDLYEAKSLANPESFSIGGPEFDYLEKNKGWYEPLRQERDAILSEYYNNPFVQEKLQAGAKAAGRLHDQYKANIADAANGRERRDWRRAAKMMDDTRKLYEAPNKYVEEIDKGNGFSKYMRSYWDGIKDVGTDRDFWTMGISEISRNFDLRGIQKTLERLQDEKGDALTEQDIDAALSPSEKAELNAWVSLTQAQADRAYTLSGAYTAGQGSAESLMFMAQFLLSQGFANVAGKALAKSGSAVASYLGRALMSDQALQRVVQQGMGVIPKGTSAVKAAEMIATGQKTIAGMERFEQGVARAGKFGSKVINGADKVLAKPVIQGVWHTVAPFTIQNISQKSLETGGGQMAVPGNPREGHMIGIGRAIWLGVLDSFIESWSESMGGALEFSGKEVLDQIGGNFGKIARWMWESPTTEVLVSGGFNGLVGEMSEEWIGNAARVAVGLMSKEEFGEFGGDIFSKDANKRAKAVESQLEMAASFGPMSLIGLGGSIRGARSKSKEYAKQRTKVEDILRSHGVTDDELKDIFNKNFDSTKEVAQKLSGYVESIVSADISDEQKASEYKEVLKLADLIGQSRTLAGLEEQQTKYDRTQMRQSISASAGRFWQSHESEVKDKNGEPIPIEQVRVVTLADGRRMYAIDNMEDGGVMAIDEATGEMEFISKDRLDSDEVTSDREMMLDDYLDERVKETKDSEETQRMETERRQQLQHVKEEARSRGSINLGTEESPLNARIVAETAEGVILEYTDANGQAVQQSTTWTDVANRIGMPINVKTDEQIDEELAGRMDSADARARQYKGIIPGTRLTASLETGDEGQTEEVGFSFESAYNDGGVVMLRGTDENGNPIEFSEEQVTNLDEALNGSRVDLSDTQEVGKAVRWTDKDGVEHSGTIYREDDGNGVTLVKYGDGVITDVRTADIIDDTQAPVQEEHGAQDNTPRDFRGNPLPLKDDGSVDQKSLWNSDPEAWVRWNDAKREDGGANSSAYVQGAISRLTEQRQQKQEQYDAESDFDRRDAIEAELREMDNRLGALNAIQQEYARKAEQEQEEAPAQQEETAPEAAVEAAPAQETPTAPEGVPTHEQAGFESLEALEQSIEEEAASSQTPLSLEEETARIEAMAGELYNGQDNGQQTELDVHPDAEGVSQVPGVSGQAAQAGVAESAREGEAVRDSDRIDDAGRDASGLRAEGNEVSGNAVPLDTVQGNDALAAERQPADAGGSAGAEGAPVVDEAAGVQGAEQQAPAEAGAESGGEVSDEVGAQFSRQTESGQEQDATVTPPSPRQRRRVQRRAKRWKKLLGDAVNVMESLDDIDASDMSAGLKARVKEEATGQGKAAGWYDVSTGKAYIYLPNINSEGEVDQKIVHEVLSHKGLRGLFNGEEGWNAFLDSIWDQMNDDARTEYLRYNGKSVATPENRRAAADEFVAHVVEYREESRQDKTAWQRLVSRVKELLNDMLGSDTFSYSDKKEDAIDALISEALGRFVSERTATKARLSDRGVASNNDEARFSVRYIPQTDEDREEIVRDLMDATGVERERAERWLQSELSLASIILSEDNAPFLDYKGDDRYTAIKEDSDYPQGTVDFNNICRKRLPFTYMYQQIQKQFPYTVITGEDLATIRNIMKDHDLMVACGLCYVEDRRQLLGEVAKEFIDGISDGFESYSKKPGADTQKEGKPTNKQKKAKKFIELIGEDKKDDLSIYDLITVDGSSRLAKEHPGIYKAFRAFNSARGQGAQNLFEGYAEYKREIMDWSDAKVKKANDNGGLRIFSYSDFEAHHLIDIVQIVKDCAARGVKIQGYTKVPAFARAIAKTNIKINRSLIPLGDTGIVDGHLAYDPVEGIDINDPDFIETNDNVGNILIGINDEQIRLAMADPFVHFIIPYHTRQGETLRRMKQVGAWTNYESSQNERNVSDGKKAKKNINIYTDVLNAAEKEGAPIKTEREFTERFLAVAKERGLIPRFDQFLNTDENGDYVFTPGYAKFVVDFKMFDENGNILEQKPVVAEFDDEFNKKILDDYVAGERAKLGENYDAVYDEIVDELGLKTRTADIVKERIGLPKANRESSDDGTDDLIRHSFAGTDGALALDKANLESFRMDNLETAKAMEDTDATPKEIKMATGWEKGKDGKWRYEIGDAYVNEGVFGEIAYLTRIGRQPRLSDIIDTDSEVMRAYPQLADVKVTAKTVKGEYGHANRRGNTINLSEGEIVKASDPVKILKQTINHEIQHFIQGYEGFAVGANSGLNVNNSESLAKAKEETPLVYGFIRYFGGTSAARLINSGAQNARTSLSNYVAANNIVGEDLEMARALARELAHMEPGEYGKLVRDSKALLKKAKKEANDNYRKSAGEVEARNAAARMPLNAEQRRILTAEETEDVAREEQMVRFSKVTDRDLIAKLDSEPKIRVYRSAQFIPDPDGNVDFDLGDGKGLQKGFLYAPMSAKVDGRWRDPISIGEWEQADENPELANDNGEFVLDKGNGDKLTVAYAPYLHTRRSPLNEQFSGAYERGNLVILESEIPESELTSGYTAEKSKKSTGEHDWPSGKVSNALAKEGMDTRKVILSRWAKPIRVVPNSEVADMISELIGDRKLSFPYNVVTPGLRRELQSRGVKFSGWQGNKPKNVNEIIAGIKEESGEEVRFSITPEQDREYMDAVEAGDMETAQRLVDQAARFAYPNSTVRDGDGNLLPVYHDTNSKRYVNRETGQDWESLDWEERDAWEQRDDWDQHWEERDFYTFDRRNARTSIEMPAFFFATEEDPYHEYGERTIKAYINLTNPVVDPVIENAGVTNTAGADAMQKYIDEGYDGFVRIDEDGKPYEYGVFDANNIKSAEPVTYDDNGDVIPLSERFNEDNDDIRFSISTNDLFARAKERFGTTRDIREAGYVLPDGTMLDFSGRHWVSGGDTSYLNGDRQVDHRDIADLEFEKDGNTPTGIETSMEDFISRGAIRIDAKSGLINLSVKPTKAQTDVLRNLIRRNRNNVWVEFGDGNRSNGYAEYNYANEERVLGDINDYFDYGIRPEGDNAVRFSKANNNQRVFISNAEAALDGIQMEKATPEQWLKMLEGKGGLKAGEDKWLGLSDWLEEKTKPLSYDNYWDGTSVKWENVGSEKAPVDWIKDYVNRGERRHSPYRSSISEYVVDRKNGVIYRYSDHWGSVGGCKWTIDKENVHPNGQIGISIAKAKISDFKRLPISKEDIANFIAENRIQIEEVHYSENARFKDQPFYADRYDATESDDVRPANDTRLAYTTEGLDNKREIALTVPTIDPYNESDKIHFGDAGEGRAVAWIRFGDANVSRAKDDAKKAYEEADKAFRDYQHELKNKYALKATGTKSVRDLATDEENARMKELYLESNQKFNDWKYGRHARERVLVIDEIQSKRHQDAREKGYKLSDERRKELFDAAGEAARRYGENPTEENLTAMNDAVRASNRASNGIPAAPFEKNWHELAMKRMLRLAAEEGYDYVAWTTGEQQSERYNISKVVEEIECIRVGQNGNKQFSLKGLDHTILVSPEGIITAGEQEFKGKPLSDVVGKEIAVKMMAASEGDVLAEKDLKVGGEGMKGFYDQILPRFMDKYGKKWGVKVDDMFIYGIGEGNTNGLTMHAVPVNEAMKESVMEGQVMFSKLSPVESSLNESNISLGNPDAMKEYHLSAIDLSKHGDVVTLSRIVAEKPGMGEGTRFMEDLAGLADRNGWTLALTPDDSFGATSVSRLKKFYKRFGFKENKGRETDYSINESMIRRPAGDNGENALTRRRANADAVAAVDRDGITGLVGAENELDFYKSIVDALPSELRSGIMDIARTNGFDIKAAAKEYIAAKAAMGLENDPTGELELFSNILRYYTENGELMDDSTVRYALWKSGQESGIMTDLASAANKNRWGVGREEDDDVRFSKGDLSGDIAATRAEISNVVEDAATEKTDKRRALTKDLLTAARAMAAQKEYDQKTVDLIVNTAKTLLKDQGIDKMTRMEVSRLLGIVRSSVGKSQDAVRRNGDALVDVVLKHLVRSEGSMFSDLLKIKAGKVNASGVEVQGVLDVRGQNVLRAVKEGMKLQLKKDGEDAESNDGTIEGALLALETRLDSTDDAVREAAEDEALGYELAKDYIENIRTSEQEEARLKSDLADAEEAKRKKELSANDFAEFRKSVNESLRENAIDRIEAYRELRDKMIRFINGSKEAAMEFREREKARKDEIRHLANSDMQGRDTSPFRQETRTGRLANSAVARFFTAPLATFDQMLRLFGEKHIAGEGYLWNKFMRQWTKSSEDAWNGQAEAREELDKKVSEVFGKDMIWADLYAVERKMPKAAVTWWDGGEMREHELTQGNLLYIYMVNKMADGRMKLRRMGITEEKVKEIERQMDPRFLELANWVQDEFLVNKRNKYNEVHKRLFGASMASIEDYFPLRVNKRSLHKQEDIATPENNGQMNSTTTGAIKKRIKNSNDLDLLNADAFSVVIEHVDEMEQWAAFAEFNRDLNTLLSDRSFRNKVMNMTTVYGAGQKLWDNFKKVCQIAGNQYKPVVGEFDRAMVNLAKGVTGAKISFRVYTAVKQFLSMPAFVSDANLVYLAKNAATPWKAWKWAMENLPLVEKRWMSRIAGDTRLMDTESDWKYFHSQIVQKLAKWGMSPNAFVDAVTVSIGAYSMYQTKYDRYIKDGYSEEEADKRAKQDATILYNETQQSSEGAFTAAVQVERTAQATAFTVFRNSSMGYQRQLHDALRNLGKHFKKGYREESIEFMTKQMVRDGLDEEQAREAATRRYNRSYTRDAVRVATFGFLVQFAWNLGSNFLYVLFGDDDDERKKMLKNDALHALYGGWAEGLAGGNIISEFLNMKYVEKSNLYGYNPELMPIVSDIKRLVQMWDSKPVAAYNELFNLGTQALSGVNPQTLTDAIVAVVDACNGDLDTSKEAMLLIMRIINAPQSQVDNFIIDELGIGMDEAKKLPYDEIARRYARYKVNREAPITGPILYSDEERKAMEDKKITGNSGWKQKIKERQELHNKQ